MDEHIFEVYLINKARHTEQNPVAEWVQLPTDAENMKAAFARIGVDGIDSSEYEVAAYESPIDGLTDRFRPGESLDELNYLAALLAQRSQEEREKFAAAMIHGDHAASIADAINLTHNLDCYWLYPTVHNFEDYGHYVVDELDELELPEAAKKYFDYKSLEIIKWYWSFCHFNSPYNILQFIFRFGYDYTVPIVSQNNSCYASRFVTFL